MVGHRVQEQTISSLCCAVLEASRTARAPGKGTAFSKVHKGSFGARPCHLWHGQARERDTRTAAARGSTYHCSAPGGIGFPAQGARSPTAFTRKLSSAMAHHKSEGMDRMILQIPLLGPCPRGVLGLDASIQCWMSPGLACGSSAPVPTSHRQDLVTSCRSQQAMKFGALAVTELVKWVLKRHSGHRGKGVGWSGWRGLATDCCWPSARRRRWQPTASECAERARRPLREPPGTPTLVIAGPGECQDGGKRARGSMLNSPSGCSS